MADSILERVAQRMATDLGAVGKPAALHVHRSRALPIDQDELPAAVLYLLTEGAERKGGDWGPLFGQLAEAVGLAPPVKPAPLTHDALLDLFKGDAVGRDVVLDPATFEDMCGRALATRPSLEIVYDAP